jgi:hypothetical protein
VPRAAEAVSPHPLSWDVVYLPLLGGLALVVIGAGLALLLTSRQRRRQPEPAGRR